MPQFRHSSRSRGRNDLAPSPSTLSNPDTIMDLATPGGYNSSGSKIIYRMDGRNGNERKLSDEEEEVERIVSAVSKGLRQNKSPRKARREPSSSANLSANASARQPPPPPKPAQVQAQMMQGQMQALNSRNRRSSSSSNRNKNKNNSSSSSRPIQHLSLSSSSSLNSNNKNDNCQPKVRLAASRSRSKSRSKIKTRHRSSSIEAFFSDEESATATEASSRQSQSQSQSQVSEPPKIRRENRKTQNRGLLHKLMHDEGSTLTEEQTADDSNVDCDYNYIDDESYGNTDSSGSSSSGSSSSSSSSGYSSSSSVSSYQRRGILHEHDDDKDNSIADDVSIVREKHNDNGNNAIENFRGDGSTASLTTAIETSFETMQSTSSMDSRIEMDEVDASHKPHKRNRKVQAEHDEDEGAFRYSTDKNAPQGLDIVARLLSGAKEISLDADSVMASGNTPVHKVARHISEALAQTSCLHRVSFCGPWRSTYKDRVVLEILFDGLLENNSVHTMILRDNPSFDWHAGYAFGTMLKAHGRIQKLDIVHCRFAGSGWNALFLGLQHSTSVKRLSIEECNNLSSEHIDGISSTIRYLGIEHLRLSKVRLHKIDIENFSVLLRAIQQTKSLKEVDLSNNQLGDFPRAIMLLSKCLSGDPVWISSSLSDSDGDDGHLPLHYQHHIEKLVLVDCGISQKSSIRTLANALDSTQAKLDHNQNEHPLVLNTIDLSQNRFGNGGARILQKLIEANPKIINLGMVGCDTSASHLKTLADRLRYNNSFLQKIGLSSTVSLAILDSVSAVENVFGGKNSNNASDATAIEGSSHGSIVGPSRICGGC